MRLLFLGDLVGEEVVEVGDDVGPGDGVLLGAELAPQRPDGGFACSELLVADDHGIGSAGTVGSLHLGAHAVAVEGAVARDARLAELGGEGTCLSPAGHVDHEHVDPCARSGNASSASHAIRRRSMPEPNPMPGVGGPPSSSTRPS